MQGWGTFPMRKRDQVGGGTWSQSLPLGVPCLYVSLGPLKGLFSPLPAGKESGRRRSTLREEGLRPGRRPSPAWSRPPVTPSRPRYCGCPGAMSQIVERGPRRGESPAWAGHSSAGSVRRVDLRARLRGPGEVKGRGPRGLDPRDPPPPSPPPRGPRLHRVGASPLAPPSRPRAGGAGDPVLRGVSR